MVYQLLHSHNSIISCKNQWDMEVDAADFFNNVLYRWKKQALENLPKLFADDNQNERDRLAEHERQVNELYSDIGRLTTQVNWLKKKSGISE
jgi:hypothetical protein